MIYKYFVQSTNGIRFIDVWDEAKLVVVGRSGMGYALDYNHIIEVKRYKDIEDMANRLVSGYGYTMLDNYQDYDKIRAIQSELFGRR